MNDTIHPNAGSTVRWLSSDQGVRQPDSSMLAGQRECRPGSDRFAESAALVVRHLGAVMGRLLKSSERRNG